MRALAFLLTALLLTGCSRIGQPDVEEMERRLLTPNLNAKNGVKLPDKYCMRDGKVVFVIPKVWGGKPTIHPDTWNLKDGVRPEGANSVGTVIFLKESRRKKMFRTQKTNKKVEITFIDYKFWAWDNKTNEYLGSGNLPGPEPAFNEEVEMVDGKPVPPHPQVTKLDVWCNGMAAK